MILQTQMRMNNVQRRKISSSGATAPLLSQYYVLSDIVLTCASSPRQSHRFPLASIFDAPERMESSDA